MANPGGGHASGVLSRDKELCMSVIPNRGSSRSFSASYLDTVYPIPRPMVSLDDLRRQHGLDLESLDDSRLQWERRCVQRRCDYEPDAVHRAWLTERLAAIDRELNARRCERGQDREPRPMAESWHRTRPAGQTVIVADQPVELPLPGGRRGYE